MPLAWCDDAQSPPSLEAQTLPASEAKFYDLDEILTLLRGELGNPIAADDDCKAPAERPTLKLGGLNFWQVVEEVERTWPVNARSIERSVMLRARPTLEPKVPVAHVEGVYRIHYRRNGGMMRVTIEPEPRLAHIRWDKAHLKARTAEPKPKFVDLEMTTIQTRFSYTEIEFMLPRQRRYPAFDAVQLVARGYSLYDLKEEQLPTWVKGAKGKVGKLRYQVTGAELGDDPERPGQRALEIRLTDHLRFWHPEDLQLRFEDHRYPRISGATQVEGIRVTFGNISSELDPAKLELWAVAPDSSEKITLKVSLAATVAER